MESLEAELDRARDLEVDALASAIETIGFECTRCGACCKAESACGEGEESDDPHTATVFPDEVRTLLDSDDTPADYDWRDVARPMPYGLDETADGTREGETFEWALATDDCGDCTFYESAAERADAEVGRCTVHGDRPLICRTYPFSVALGGTSQPMGEAVDEAGLVRAHECEGLGRDIDRASAERLATALQERAVRELEEAIAVRDRYELVGAEGVVVHDSEGPKRPDGRPVDPDG